MVIAEPIWLQTLGDIAGVILVIELSLALIITCALMVAMAIGARWLHIHVIPVVKEYLPQAQQAMTITEHGSDSLVNGVAEFYGRRQAVETGLRVLLFGKNQVEQVREEQEIYAEEALQRIAPPDELTGLETAYAAYEVPPARGGNALETLQAPPEGQHNGRGHLGPLEPDTDTHDDSAAD